jgi:hypothetical protein
MRLYDVHEWYALTFAEWISAVCMLGPLAALGIYSLIPVGIAGADVRRRVFQAIPLLRRPRWRSSTRMRCDSR